MDLFEGMTKPRKQVNIDVAPMMDMVFILLIFFIVTSTFTRETGVDVTKPQAQSASEVQRENILVAITREGSIHINERQVDPVGLREVLSRLLSDNPSREVVLVADKESSTGLVVSVIDICNLSGAKKVSISALNRE